MVHAMQNCMFNRISGLIFYHFDETNSLHKPTQRPQLTHFSWRKVGWCMQCKIVRLTAYQV